jgi:hypothetical protein
MFRSAEYMAWLDECDKVVRAAKPQPVKGSYKLLVRAVRPDKRRRDIDNIGSKAINDMLQHTGIVEDDCLCEAVLCKWVSSGPDTVVNIIPSGGSSVLQAATSRTLQGSQGADAEERNTRRETPASVYQRERRAAKGRISFGRGGK